MVTVGKFIDGWAIQFFLRGGVKLWMKYSKDLKSGI